jgi:hypothetical protein
MPASNLKSSTVLNGINIPDGPIIVTHCFPIHLDEYIAITIARENVDGFAEAPVMYLTDAQLKEMYKVKKVEEILELGIGECSPYNEHATSVHDRIEGECCATLIAKKFNLQEETEWKELLAYALIADTNPKQLFQDKEKCDHRWALLHNIVFMAGKFYGVESAQEFEKFMEITISSLRAHFSGMMNCDAGSSLIIREFKGRFGAYPKVRLGAFESDEPEALTWGLSAKGGHYNICVVKRENGQVQIMGKKPFHADLARAIRVAELKKMGILPPAWYELTGERYPECYWFFQATMLFNGSLTHPEVPATLLSLEEIVDVIEKTMAKLPHASCEQQCSPTAHRDCPLFQYGFSVCQVARANNRRAISAEKAKETAKV